MAAGLTALREIDEVGSRAGHAVQEELDLDVTHAGGQRGGFIRHALGLIRSCHSCCISNHAEFLSEISC